MKENLLLVKLTVSPAGVTHLLVKLSCVMFGVKGSMPQMSIAVELRRLDSEGRLMVELDFPGNTLISSAVTQVNWRLCFVGFEA